MTSLSYSVTGVRRVAIAVALLLITSCSEPLTGAASSRQTSELHFLRARADAPALASSAVSFWAKRGADRGAALYYRPRPGASDSTKLVELRIDSGSLMTRPDGTPFAPGDSVLIRVAVIDPTRMILSFEPSGIRFSSASPARLVFSFAEANDDLNDDGNVDEQDNVLRTQLSFWRQEAPGGLWTQLQTALFLDLKEANGAIPGFSGYALAY